LHLLLAALARAKMSDEVFSRCARAASAGEAAGDRLRNTKLLLVY
jgi:hypothetical protein